MTTKPFLKWVGGKTQILNEVFSHFPKTMANYHEPFVGGGSVLLGLLNRVRAGEIEVTGGIFASDANSGLINLYQHVQANMAELLGALKDLATAYSRYSGTTVHRAPKTLEEATTSQESFYYWTRSRFTALQNDDRFTAAAAAMFLFLNKTCFRGLYREGPKGFNVPFGHYPAPSVYDEAELMAVSDLIQGVEFACQDVQHSLLDVGPDDFIYLDPPYAPETATSFVGYTSNGFTLEDHRTLFACVKALPLSKFLLSNADVPVVTDAFQGYQKKVIPVRRTINSKKPESRTKELLIWN